MLFLLALNSASRARAPNKYCPLSSISLNRYAVAEEISQGQCIFILRLLCQLEKGNVRRDYLLPDACRVPTVKRNISFK